jgi:predicted nucleic acid-binding protein
VVDASVLTKCFIAEDGSRAALQLLRDHPKLLAPSLSRMEVAAAICRHARKGFIPAEEAKDKCRQWFGLLTTDAVVLTPDEELIEGAIHLAVTFKHPLQDCLYLELMRHVNGQLVTADRKFHKRVSSSYVDVQLLEGVPTAGESEAV